MAICLSTSCMLIGLFLALPIYAGVCYGTKECGVAVLASLIPISVIMLVVSLFVCIFACAMWSREYLFYVTRKPTPMYRNSAFSYSDYDGCFDEVDNCCC